MVSIIVNVKKHKIKQRKLKPRHKPYAFPKIYLKTECKMGFPGGSELKNAYANAGVAGDTGSTPGLKRSLEEEMATPPVFLPGESHGQRSLAGYSCKESDMSEHAHMECKTLKILTENMKKFTRTWYGDEFLCLNPKANFMKEKQHKFDLIKLKLSALLKKIVNKMNSHILMTRYLQNIFNKELIHKIYQEV